MSSEPTAIDPQMNSAPAGFNAATDLPPGFLDFLLPLHREFTRRQRELLAIRAETLDWAGKGRLPDYYSVIEATAWTRATSNWSFREYAEAQTGFWKVKLPDWCLDQRCQVVVPADDAKQVLRMLISGVPGVVLDLEESMANQWPNLMLGIENAVQALKGTLTYQDGSTHQPIAPGESKSVLFVRPRGLHMGQAGVLEREAVAAPLFDVAMIAYQVDAAQLGHPLSFYIPKAEDVEEGKWWRDLFQAVARARGLPESYIRCMALVESHPLPYALEEFVWNLRSHIMGVAFERWSYTASLLHFNLHDPHWVLPDRNTLPHDIPFLQRVRELVVEICHKRGLLAIGGMAAPYPEVANPASDSRAMTAWEAEMKSESESLMDGALTGHLAQAEAALRRFPDPNQLAARQPRTARHPDLRPLPAGVGRATLAGTRAAVRAVILYRHGVLRGKGTSPVDGYVEDLATERLYRLMIAQRALHGDAVVIADDAGSHVRHTPELISRLFDEELGRIIAEFPSGGDPSQIEQYREARRLGEEMIALGQFDPI